METREIAIKWWNMLGTLSRMQFAHGLDAERFPEPPRIPPFKSPELTGREIELIWDNAGKPSTSMVFRNMQPSELLGRVVRIEYSNGRIDFSFIIAVTKTSFVVYNGSSNFDIKNGSKRGGGSWDTTQCELSTREAWDVFSKEMRAKRERDKLKNAIIDHTQRKDGFAPTLEQLKAAAEALGLVKV